MIDFAVLFKFSDPVANRPYRGQIDITSEEAWRISRAEAIPTRKPIIHWAMGGRVPSDVIWTTLAAPLIVSSRVLAVLRASGFSGWDAFPVSVFDKQGNELADYVILAIKGRCDPIDLSASEVVLRQYPGGWFPEFKGAYFSEPSWDRSDLFMERTDKVGHSTLSRFATGAVIHALKKARIGNLHYESLRDYQVAVSIYQSGSSSHKLPHDIAERIDEAYRKTGLPRPSARASNSPRIRNEFVERPLNEEESHELRIWKEQCAQHLNLSGDDDSERIILGVKEHVDRIRPLNGNILNDQALELGCLWAEQVVRATDWSWAALQGKDQVTRYGIVSENRAFVIFPGAYFQRLLADAGRDNTVLLLFNMVRSDKLPIANHGAYDVLG